MRRALVALALLALAACAHLREPQVLVPFAVTAVATIPDAALTIHAVRVHGATEVNPFMAPFAGSRWLYTANVGGAAFMALWADEQRHKGGLLSKAWLVNAVGQTAFSLYAWRANVATHRRLHAAGTAGR